MKTARDESIVRPRPVKGFDLESVVCIPYDPVPDVLLSHIRRMSVSERRLGGGLLFALPGSAVLYDCLGAPASVAALERLITSGVSRIVVLGFCGSLSPRFRIGDVLSVSRARSDEGTSRRYVPGRKVFRPSPALKKILEERLEKLHIPFIKGRCVSTDAPYRETPAWLEAMRKMGQDAVDMEASAVFALAAYRDVEAAALMAVSDELFSGRWKVGSPKEDLRDKIAAAFLPFIREGQTYTSAKSDEV